MLCDGCAKCCLTQGSPPGFIIFVADPGWDIPEDDEDLWRYNDSPPEAKEVLKAYADRLVAGQVADGEPCCWLRDGRCRWYQWRPTICEDFEVDGLECLEWRLYG